ncbi:MAG TPA: DUF1667 domain-containing protein [Synergistaceae bacterium]|nr:DUF1667 domain-containing protein [Synergistaceae bacterium]HPJ27017.1 DUF1667 domain-containing protein [Synergistaceae bacterium]HPQ38322.1 DUF1667 domain-containing protein [Synergistaceae bacterium]
MTLRELTCVVCPNGCPLKIVCTEDDPPRVESVEGHLCPRGIRWARQEVEAPQRTIASSVLVAGGVAPLASVRTDRPIPLEKIPSVMQELRKLVLPAPLALGDVVLRNPAGTDCAVIVTRGVEREKEKSRKIFS